jgi:hypothetical protein
VQFSIACRLELVVREVPGGERCEWFTEGSRGFERFGASRERRTPGTFRAPLERLEPLEPLERRRPLGVKPTAYYTDLKNALDR